ncbi:MAG: UDP-N-acetylmuramoyl-tripeptide--D-alanyl-D-alanine ligase [Betaproteobacteria bacterium]
MDTQAAARAVAGRMIGRSVVFARVTTDTRALRDGDLFVALKGENFDGHDFVPAALAKGAAAAMIDAARQPAGDGNYVAVADPLQALGRLAAHWRQRFTLPLAVVVGSNGKTTVKEMLASILRAEFGGGAVLATQGNLNNAIGLPLTLLRLRSAHRAAVIELGMNHRDETRDLAFIALPTIVLINNAQREHQEFMTSVADVAAEHADAIAALPRDGTAIINADDMFAPMWTAAAQAVGARVITFALDHSAEVGGRGTLRDGGSDITITLPSGPVDVALEAPGAHMMRNALAAAAAALASGASPKAIREGLAAFRPAPGRLVALRAASGARVFDDSYNANPDSMRAAIDVLAAAPGTRVLVIGDMGEVGTAGPAFHREIGVYARACGIDRLLATGEMAREAVAAFGGNAEHFSDIHDLVSRARAAAGVDVSVLVKGSRFMRMERVVAALTGAAVAGAH